MIERTGSRVATQRLRKVRPNDQTLTECFQRRYRAPPRVEAAGEEAVEKLGHRNYVGGMWEEIGKLQFDFLVKQGLKPSHCFLDIGCGSFRGGIHFINYLDAGNYLGIDKEKALIDLGIEKELGNTVYEKKKPEVVVSDNFTFERFLKSRNFRWRNPYLRI